MGSFAVPAVAHKLDLLFLDQTLKIAAAHKDMGSAKPDLCRGMANYNMTAACAAVRRCGHIYTKRAA
ncbi:hypothetical protein MicloDRAFT_00002790 [Microvirga lotononidis]|uniref:Uncharacterized protein n=1 Tax=Microvirga lotononidis TaxID=864069 RepID=I4Z456_9HYPH|nr:hypothetical protein MicloDRAFT_00002790 [Microvirga lotononidis]